ncbi:MAG: hypothetical protein O3B01_09260 [Planctomycetota bacterium]|nr:hypothetical protein [Planctomycetota bacterium]MDA1138756.1 hypothetical protein [Planctomycetota bacterium]
MTPHLLTQLENAVSGVSFEQQFREQLIPTRIFGPEEDRILKQRFGNSLLSRLQRLCAGGEFGFELVTGAICEENPKRE